MYLEKHLKTINYSQCRILASFVAGTSLCPLAVVTWLIICFADVHYVRNCDIEIRHFSQQNDLYLFLACLFWSISRPFLEKDSGGNIPLCQVDVDCVLLCRFRACIHRFRSKFWYAAELSLRSLLLPSLRNFQYFCSTPILAFLLFNKLIHFERS